MLFGGSTQCRTKNEDGERNLFHQKLWKLFLYGRNKRKNKNKLVGKVQKINADSVDRISRMVFNCDLCLKIWIFFSMKETRGKKPNLLERCKKKLMKALLTGFHAWRSVVIFVYDQTWPLVFWFVFLLGTSTLLKCFNKLFCGGIGVSWAIKLLVSYILHIILFGIR